LGDVYNRPGIALAVLRGERGPRRDVVLLNAAAALVAAGAAADLRAGVALAAESIDGGRALAALEGLRRLTQAAAQRTA
ncbi:MAG: anthranilate phosphoribosyltransferase, partial [Clostridia bacterium]|nr:anthranilate phosphoribosyltransferase [Clostridia bacterium]